MTLTKKNSPRKRAVFAFGVGKGINEPVSRSETRFVETAEKGTFSDREVASEQKTSGTASAVEKM